MPEEPDKPTVSPSSTPDPSTEPNKKNEKPLGVVGWFVRRKVLTVLLAYFTAALALLFMLSLVVVALLGLVLRCVLVGSKLFPGQWYDGAAWYLAIIWLVALCVFVCSGVFVYWLYCIDEKRNPGKTTDEGANLGTESTADSKNKGDDGGQGKEVAAPEATAPAPALPTESEKKKPLGVRGWIITVLSVPIAVAALLAWCIGPTYLYRALVAVSADHPWLYWAGLPVFVLLCLLGGLVRWLAWASGGSKKALAAADANWDAGRQADAVADYKEHYAFADDRAKVIGRIVDFEAATNPVDARQWVEKGLDDKLNVTCDDPTAQGICAQVKKERDATAAAKGVPPPGPR